MVLAERRQWAFSGRGAMFDALGINYWWTHGVSANLRRWHAQEI